MTNLDLKEEELVRWKKKKWRGEAVNGINSKCKVPEGVWSFVQLRN